MFPYQLKESRLKISDESANDYAISKIFGSASKIKNKAASVVDKYEIRHISMSPGDLGKRYLSCLMIRVRCYYL